MKPGGDPIDAITAVGTALQLALESAGAKGQNLGQLVTSATSRKILVDRDSPLADGIAAIVTWAREQRNQRGSTHQVESVSASEAWLTVRVAGALILRIVKA